MSENKVSNNAVISSEPARKKVLGVPLPRVKDLSRFELMLVLLVLVLAIMYAGAQVYSHILSSNLQKKSLQPVVQQTASEQLFLKATSLSNQGFYDAAQQAFASALAQTSDKGKQMTIYLNQSTVAYNAKQYTASIGYAQKAEALEPSAQSASLIAQAAEANNDKALALQYYQKELKRIGTPQDDTIIPDLQAKIKSLGGSS